MARFLVQVIREETEITELLYLDRDPWYDPGRIIECDDPLPLDKAFQVSGLCASLSEARRLIAQGGAYVQGERCSSDEEFWDRGMSRGRYLLLRKGKRSIALLEVLPVRVRVRLSS